MASIDDLKPRFQALPRPLVCGLANAGVTANQVTVSALILSILAGRIIYLYPQQKKILLLIPLGISEGQIQSWD